MKIWSPRDNKYHYIVKIRGFTINATAANVLNYKTLRNLVKTLIRTGVQDKLNVVIRKILKTPDREVTTAIVRKTYRCVYDKRRLLRDGTTLPFGY